MDRSLHQTVGALAPGYVHPPPEATLQWFFCSVGAHGGISNALSPGAFRP